MVFWKSAAHWCKERYNNPGELQEEERTMAIKKETFTVEGMSCGHCKMAVEKEVKALPGMLSAAVDLSAKSLTVEYDGDKTNPAAIRMAVEEAGFTVA